MRKLYSKLTTIFTTLLIASTLPTNSKADSNQVRCIATAIYYEARGSTNSDKLGVANVVMNRVRSNRFPDNPCSVVLQRNQFSWTRGSWSHNITYQNLAQRVFNREVSDNTRGSLYFHTPAVNPSWSRNKPKIRIGSHYYVK